MGAALRFRFEQEGAALDVPQRASHQAQRVTVSSIDKIGAEDGPVQPRRLGVVVTINRSGPIEHQQQIGSVPRGRITELGQLKSFQRRPGDVLSAVQIPVRYQDLCPGQYMVAIPIRPLEIVR